MPEWLLIIEKILFGNYKSCPKNHKAQQKLYPYPGDLIYIETENCRPSFLYSYKLSVNNIYIWACGTIPEYRGKGYFSKILSTFYDKIEDNSSVFFVSVNNSIEKVFTSIGFKKSHNLSFLHKEQLIKFNRKLIHADPGQLLERYYFLKDGSSVNNGGHPIIPLSRKNLKNLIMININGL